LTFETAFINPRVRKILMLDSYKYLGSKASSIALVITLAMYPFTLIFSLGRYEPFYIIPGCVFIVSVLAKIKNWSVISAPTSFYYLLAFVTCTTLYNLGYTLLGSHNHLYNAGVYIFLSSFFLALYHYIKEDANRFSAIFVAITLFCTSIYVGYFILNGFTIGHNSSFMYNINQFAFWGFLSFVLLDIAPQSSFSKRWVRIVQFFLMLFVLFSLSRSATGGLVVYMLLKCIMPKKRALLMVSLFFIFLLVVFFSHNWLMENLELYEIYFNRFFRSREFRDFDKLLKLRGWLPVVENPIYLLIGAGEGSPTRFGHPTWIHCSILNIAFSYGIVSLILFIGFIKNCWTKHVNTLIVILSLLASSLFTSMTHNLHMWIILALLVYYRENLDINEKSKISFSGQ